MKCLPSELLIIHPQTDALVFSVIAQILYIPIDTPHKAYIEKNVRSRTNAHEISLRFQCHNLIEHTERIKAEFWPDWDKVTKQLSLNGNWAPKR